MRHEQHNAAQQQHPTQTEEILYNPLHVNKRFTHMKPSSQLSRDLTSATTAEVVAATIKQKTTPSLPGSNPPILPLHECSRCWPCSNARENSRALSSRDPMSLRRRMICTIARQLSRFRHKQQPLHQRATPSCPYPSLSTQTVASFILEACGIWL
jgi:hypothetical protein